MGPSDPVRRFIARRPSAVVALAGLGAWSVGGSLGQAGASIDVLGFVLVVVGLIGVMGHRQAVANETMVQWGWTRLDGLSGPEFERFLVALFRQRGYRVTHTGGRGDFGADLLLETPVGRVVVQAKAWTKPVGHEAVQQAVAAIRIYGASRAMVVATGLFTRHAQTLARANAVDLWDRPVLTRQLSERPVALPVDPRERFRAELRAGSPRALRGVGWALLTSLAVLGALASTGGRSRRRSRHRRRW